MGLAQVSFVGISVGCGRIRRRFLMRAAILITFTFAMLSACGSELGGPNQAEPTEPRLTGTTAHQLTREGEILVIEGGVSNVTQVGPGLFSLEQEDLQAILSEVYAEVPDVFDTVMVFTTFTDQQRPGIAETFNLNNVVQGIGLEVKNDRDMFGLPLAGGRLSTLSVMNSLLMWGNGSLNGLDADGGFFRGVMAEELARRWLFHARFVDLSGNSNNALLGRANRNWSRLAQADGSFLDGNRWVDNGDGTFTNTGSNLGFAPLDLYLMGLGSADDVEDIFYIANATNMNGDPLTGESLIPTNTTINGDLIPVTFDQILQGVGVRVPPPLTRIPYDRAIVVLVTAPGQTRADWVAELQVLQNLVARFPQSWNEWTGGAVCMQSTERCAEPVIGLSSFAFDDDNDDLVGPGEEIRVNLTLQNGGLGTAENVSVELRPSDASVQVVTNVFTAPPIPSGARVQMSDSYVLSIPSTVGCGDRLAFDVIFRTQEGPVFQDRFEVEVGSRELAFDPLNEDVYWTVNPENRDTALEGQWALGTPEQVVAPDGALTQPDADRTSGEGTLAFMTGPARSDGESTIFTANDLDGGRTTLESPIYALGDTLDPSLVFYVWRFGRNYLATGGPADLTMSDLVIEVSNDGGANYVELGRFGDNTNEWTRVSYRIRSVITPTNRMRFRFIAEEEETTMVTDLALEVGIDDVQIIDSLAECTDGPINPGGDAGMMDAAAPPPPDNGGGGGGGCTCVANGSAPSTPAVLFVLFALLGLGFVARRPS